MTSRVSYRLNDCPHLKIVSVIASFNPGGDILPLYVRIDGESLKIHTAYQADSTYSLLHFNCEVMDYDRVKPIKLTYHIGDHKWSIPV